MSCRIVSKPASTETGRPSRQKEDSLFPLQITNIYITRSIIQKKTKMNLETNKIGGKVGWCNEKDEGRTAGQAS